MLIILFWFVSVFFKDECSSYVSVMPSICCRAFTFFFLRSLFFLHMFQSRSAYAPLFTSILFFLLSKSVCFLFGVTFILFYFILISIFFVLVIFFLFWILRFSVSCPRSIFRHFCLFVLYILPGNSSTLCCFIEILKIHSHRFVSDFHIFFLSPNLLLIIQNQAARVHC